MSLKDDLLRQADDDFGAFKRALVGLDDAAMRRPCLGAWGVREIFAHMLGWQREMIPVLERVARGEKPLAEGVSYDDLDGWNARLVAARQGLTVEGLRAALDVSHRDFLAAARAVPEARFEPGKTATRVVDLNGPHHYREHTAQILAWRRRTGI
jgi:Mycothiol maleylpyruvate isomerase N-terminal domain